MAIGFFTSYAISFLRLFIYEIRLQDAELNKFYIGIHQNKPAKFTFNESLILKEHQPPKNETSLVWLGFPVYINISEINLHTGWCAKEIHCSVSTLRIFKNRLLKIIRSQSLQDDSTTNIFITLGGWGVFARTNKLLRKNFAFENLILTDSVLNSVVRLFYELFSGTRERAGLILYGPPGNGKTSLIRTIACEFKYDIYCPIFRPDMTNANVIEMFSNIPNTQKCIIVLEDFDSLFNRRVSQLNNCAFSFDVFLNIIDGLYIDVSNFIFIITANDISKIDSALKNRPSRFDMVLNVDNPNYENRIKLLEKTKLVNNIEQVASITEGISCAVLCELSKRQPSSLLEATKIVEEFSASEAEDTNMYTMGSTALLSIPSVSEPWNIIGGNKC